MNLGRTEHKLSGGAIPLPNIGCDVGGIGWLSLLMYHRTWGGGRWSWPNHRQRPIRPCARVS
jgi:hypothetical protein